MNHSVSPDALALFQRLQRKHCLVLTAGLALFILGACALLMGAQLIHHATVLEAEELVLHDKDGHRRVILEVADDGPRLVLFDENEKPRAILKIDKEGPGLALGDGLRAPVNSNRS